MHQQETPNPSIEATHYSGCLTYKHLFCAECGIKAFYVPRSHPEGYSVNARCLDEGTVEQLTVIPSDGKNWENTHPSTGRQV